jgi:hypothetical protein
MSDNETTSGAEASADETAETSPETPVYRLTLEGNGIHVERDIDETAVLAVMSALMGGDAGIARPRPTIKPGGIFVRPEQGAGGARGQSLREFLNEVGAKRNIDKIVAIAVYLEDERAYDAVTSAQLRSEFKTAREPIPGNLPRDLHAAVAAGWLANSPGSGDEYYVTKSGRHAVEERFSPEVTKGAKASRPSRRRRTRREGDEE